MVCKYFLLDKVVADATGTVGSRQGRGADTTWLPKTCKHMLCHNMFEVTCKFNTVTPVHHAPSAAHNRLMTAHTHLVGHCWQQHAVRGVQVCHNLRVASLQCQALQQQAAAQGCRFKTPASSNPY